MNDSETPRTRLVPVMGVGANAGGMQAVEQLFSTLPAETGLAWVVVLHADEPNARALPDRLSHEAAMRVEVAKDGDVIQPDTIYVREPGTMVGVEGPRLAVRSQALTSLPGTIDHLFQSLARSLGPRAAGIVLSGDGHDGADGAAAIARAGGLVLVQSPGEADHSSMPAAVAETGCAHALLPIDEMLGQVEAFARTAQVWPGSRLTADLSDLEPELERLYSLLQQTSGQDFRQYRKSTLHRRIQRRLGLVGAASVGDYVQQLERSPAEVDALVQDILIGVTRFFRGKDAFASLAREVLPRLVVGRDAADPIRAWVPGCSTGEEAWSLAILLHEQLASLAAPPRVQIFATDIDEEALRIARAGVYGPEVEERIGKERLERFFEPVEGGWRVKDVLRESCLFAAHGLLRDPPFSRLDLISCRNVLIYMDRVLQQRALRLFHYALRPGGHLFLGAAEKAETPPGLFDPVDKPHRIYRANEDLPRRSLGFPVLEARPSPRVAVPEQVLPRPSTRSLSRTVERLLVEHHAPPSATIDRDGRALYFTGRTAPFLGPSSGPASHDLLDMVRPELRGALREAIIESRESGQPAERVGAVLGDDGGLKMVRLQVRPLPAAGGIVGALLVLFSEAPPLPLERREPAGDTAQLVRRLEDELLLTREQLRNTIADLEASNEELKASNEELLSMNEEFQSANEELQTSREELQAINEELETLNQELEEKIHQLDEANADLQNLLRSTRIPTIFLDKELRIARFTPSATEVYRLSGRDEGRPLQDITARFVEQDLHHTIESVLDDGQPREQEVALGRKSFLARATPYLRLDGTLDGVVLSFVDVTEIKQAMHALRIGERRFHAALESSQVMLFEQDRDLRYTWAYNTSRPSEQILGRTDRELLSDPADAALMDELKRRVLESGEGVREEVRLNRNGNPITYDMRVEPLRDETGAVAGITCACVNITLLSRAQEALRAADAAKDEFLAILAHELRNPLSAIVLATQLWRREGTSREQREQAEIIVQRQVRHLGRLVDDLLDVSRITRGRLTLERQPLNLCELVNSTMADHEALFDLNGLSYELALPEHPVLVLGDQARLAQILGNLLQNAAKYTNRGGHVSVRLFIQGADAVLEVEDTGIGIEEELIKRVFEPFAQADRTLHRTRGGLGLGLSLVRSLTEMHGGEASVRSEGPGRGSIFTVRLPLLSTGAAPEKKGSPTMSERAFRRILVIEDNQDAAETLCTLLRLSGHEVHLAVDGTSGVKAARKVQPEVILCDIGLPGMSGFEVAEALRADPATAKALLVAISGYGREEDRQRGLQAGFDRYLAKPVDPDVLDEILVSGR